MKKKASRKKTESFRLITFIKKTLILFFTFTILWVIAYRFVNPPITWLMVQRGVERMIDGKGWKLEKQWRSSDELSDNLKLAAVAGEDANFLNHWGFDVNSIQKAYLRNKEGKPLRGGSTISQQVAKNVFLWPGRSYIRKAFEAYFTTLIEIFWSKERILEVYLNCIETGDGIYGAEAATLEYYDKEATSLTKRQAALLIAILPNPLRWSPEKPTKYIYYKQNLILRNMRMIKKLKFDVDKKGVVGGHQQPDS